MAKGFDPLGIILIGAGAFLLLNKSSASAAPVLPSGIRPSTSNRTSTVQANNYIGWVQSSLNILMGCGLAVDGKMGPLTTACIRRFQAMRGLTVDGIMGSETDWEIKSALGQPGYIETPNPYTVPEY